MRVLACGFWASHQSPLATTRPGLGGGAAMITAMFTPALAPPSPPSCRETSSGGTCCHPMTAQPTDERRTNDQGPDRRTGDQALHLQLQEKPRPELNRRYILQRHACGLRHLACSAQVPDVWYAL